jgi:flavin reductase (DIM6/NTAB) family NADH-FMN oxidoreductase RutF
MDPNAKKTSLRMIQYGIYVLTADDGDGRAAAATVNWVTQTSFDPPLVVIGNKSDSGIYHTLKKSGFFAINFLGKGQQDIAFGFFKPSEREGNTLGGQPFRDGSTGAPILEKVPASVECRVVEIVERGDHHIVVGEVVDAHVAQNPEGRPDEASLHMKDLGEKVFYGG